MTSVVLWHPGSSISTSDVSAGLSYGLEKLGVGIIPYATGAHIEIAGRELMRAWHMAGKPTQKPTDADRLYIAAQGILERACRGRAVNGTEWVLVVSGMYQHPDYFIFLRQAGFKLAMVLTESPYDIEKEIKVAPIANVVFTNERTAVDTLRTVNRDTHYLAHAWHPAVHSVAYQGVNEDVVSHDVVFVGTYFQEREEFLASIDWTGIDLGLYGGTDDIDGRTTAGRKLKPFIRGGFTKNNVTAQLYRRAKVGLNFHRTSKGYGHDGQHIQSAESLNPRCYELAATGCFFVTDYRAEAEEVFRQSWQSQTFSSAKECEALIRAAIRDDDMRRTVSELCQDAVRSHNWLERTRQLVSVIDEYDARQGARAA